MKKHFITSKKVKNSYIDDQKLLLNNIFMLNKDNENQHAFRMSEIIWKINWKDFFPHPFSKGNFQAVPSTFSRTLHFLKKHFKNIYELEKNNNGFISEDYTSEKLRYYEMAGDFFEFRDIDHNKTIGIFIGTPIDWSSYYLRHASILPDYHNYKIYQEFIELLLYILKKHKVERVEGATSPSNLVVVHSLNKMGFNISGMELSERWGSMLRFVKFLSSKHESTFLNQFCVGTRPQLNQRKNKMEDQNEKEICTI